MKHIYIDGIDCEFDSAPNVLELAIKNGIDIPHLCYCEGLSSFGGCRLCVVETSKGAIEAACTLVPEDGMSIRTNSPRLRKHRQMILELMLASHRADCTVCEKSGECLLQSYAKRYGVRTVRFANEYRKAAIDASSRVIIRDPSKCILCGRCVRMCSEIQGIHAIDFAGRGADTFISCGLGKGLSDTSCVSCGQCAAVCPTAALTVKNEMQDMWRAIYDSGKKVAVQIDPAVYAAIGDELGIQSERPLSGKLVSALRSLGVDCVFDTSCAAYANAKKLAEKLSSSSGAGKALISSECFSWVTYIEKLHPELKPALSENSSAMLSLAEYIRSEYGYDEMFSVAVMPCSARKAELYSPANLCDGEKLVDLVLTTRELAAMIKEAGIDLSRLPDSEPDALSCPDSRSCACCGVTGGLTEAVISCMGQSFKRTETEADGIRSIELASDALKLRFAVVSGLANAERLLKAVCSGAAVYDFIDVSACPGGCVNGSGQHASPDVIKRRSDMLGGKARA